MNKEDNALLLEQLRWRMAEYAHISWSNWMKYLFTKGKLNKSGSFTIDKKSVERWQRQMQIDFYDLSEEERISDFTEVDNILKVQKYLMGGS